MIRFEGRVPNKYWRGLWAFVPVAIAVHLATNYGFRLYYKKSRASTGGRQLALAGILAGTLVVAIGGWGWDGQPLGGLLDQPLMPLSALVLGAALSVVGFTATHLIRRRHAPSDSAPRPRQVGHEPTTDSLGATIRGVRELLGPMLVAATLGGGVLTLLVILRQPSP